MSYPYFLLKSEPISLRLMNFYFTHHPQTGVKISLYRLRGCPDVNKPDPAEDILYIELEYSSKKTVDFEFDGREVEHFYAVDCRTGKISRLLRFEWKDELVKSCEL